MYSCRVLAAIKNYISLCITETGFLPDSGCKNTQYSSIHRLIYIKKCRILCDFSRKVVVLALNRTVLYRITIEKSLKRCGKGPTKNKNWLSRCGKVPTRNINGYPDAERAFSKSNGAVPERNGRIGKRNSFVYSCFLFFLRFTLLILMFILVLLLSVRTRQESSPEYPGR